MSASDYSEASWADSWYYYWYAWGLVAGVAAGDYWGSGSGTMSPNGVNSASWYAYCGEYEAYACGYGSGAAVACNYYASGAPGYWGPYSLMALDCSGTCSVGVACGSGKGDYSELWATSK